MPPSRRSLVLMGMAGCAMASIPVFARSGYPSKPITVVVSYPPGGDSDALARLFAEKLTSRLRQPILIDNKPGAAGTIGNTFVSRAAPDGYTLLYTPSPFTTAPLVLNLSAAASYDVLHGFEPVAQMGVQPMVLVANPGIGAKTLPALIAAAKAGQRVSYASPGTGSTMHIAGEWLNKAAGVHFVHVPYRGVAPSVTDAVSGHVDLAWVSLGPVRQYLRTGKLVPFAIADAQRSNLAPDIPTLAEMGYKGVLINAWTGFMAPRRTPAGIVKILNEHLNAILKESDVIAQLTFLGTAPVGGPPSVLAAANARDYATMGKVIRELGIQGE